MKVSTEDFCNLVLECNFDAYKVHKLQLERYPDLAFSTTTRVEQRIANLRRKGLLPLDSGNSVSVGEVLKGSSTLYDATGSVKQQWVKTDVPKQQALEAFAEAMEGLMTSLPTIAPSSPPKAPTDSDDLMCVYTIGDAHIGMYAYAAEAGEDYNLDIAETRHTKAMELLVSQAPEATEAFIVDVGDYLHVDNFLNRTTASGAPLDAAARYPQILELSLLLTVKLINLALTKHQVVHWRSAIGNHNDVSSIMMNQFVKAYFRHEPRVVVHDEPSMFMYHQFGKNLIGITHGHTVKPDKLGEIMAVDKADLWSDTKFRYWYCGHAAA